jgi:PKD repeat protein
MPRYLRSLPQGGTWVGPIVIALALLLLFVPSARSGEWTAPMSAAPVHSGARESTGPTPSASPAPALTSPEIVIHLPTPTWVNVTSALPGAAPPIAEGGSSAYDPIDYESVYFGGCIQGGACPSNQTWVFAHGIWTNETNPRDAPPARSYASMDYDANMRAVLLFGGIGDSGVRSDTWIFTNATWTNVTFVGTGPPALEGASMAFDPQPEENGSVLFGGCAPGEIFILCSNETWVWQGWSGWVRLDTSIAPPAVGWAPMAYDAAGGFVLLFGGFSFFYSIGGTWELYAGQWWAVDTKTLPDGRSDAAMVYVPSLSGVLMFGGINASSTFSYLNDTWLFTGDNWGEESPAASPQARSDFGLSLDGTGTTPIVVGGENDTHSYGDTWAYEFTPSASLAFNLSTTEVSEGVTVSAEVGSGTAPYNATFSFGDGARGFVSGPGPTLSVAHGFASAGTFLVSVTVTDSVGATVRANPADFTVTADPSITVSATPTSCDVGQAIAFDSTVVSDGAPPLHFRWNFGDKSAVVTGPRPSHTYPAPGAYRVYANATDADGVIASASLIVRVAADPTITVAAAPATVTTGAPVTFFANVSGGTEPYGFAWVFAHQNGSAFPSPTYRYLRAGTYTVEVWVNDSAGESVHGDVVITVSNPPSPAGSGALRGPLWFWGGLGGVAAVGVVGSVLIARRGPARPPKN